MNRLLRCAGNLLLLVAVSSCSHTLNKPVWGFEKTAIHMHLKADNKLNLYNHKAHTLYVCFFQLEALNAFDKLTEDETGIRQLLDCRLFDDSVAAADSKVIHAGEDIVLTLDRADRARYIAFVAGYSSTLNDERVIRRHKFQVHKTDKGLFRKVFTCKPCELSVEASFGPHQIEYSKIIPNDEMTCNDECE